MTAPAPDQPRPGPYVALGDSLTSGLGVGLHTPPERTWPELLGSLLVGPGSRFDARTDVHRLAVSGSTSAEVRRDQLPAALAARPVLASVVVGLNDVLRTSCHVDELQDAIGATVTALTGNGAHVLLATMHDPTAQLRLPAVWAARVQDRVAVLNGVLRAVGAADPSVTLMHLAAVPELRSRTAWAPDRIHLSLHGHALVAVTAARALGLDPGSPPPEPPAPGDAAHVRWMLTSGVYWLVTGGARRSLPLLAAPLQRGIGTTVKATWSAGSGRPSR